LNINSSTALGIGTFTLTAGTLDNTSGGALTLVNSNPITLAGFTFIGSNGANSNLNLGYGAVAMAASSTIAVLNSNATVTIGGLFTGAGAFVKTGAGTL